jgi:uncharacterized protein YgiM (DUF1202 family)
MTSDRSPTNPILLVVCVSFLGFFHAACSPSSPQKSLALASEPQATATSVRKANAVVKSRKANLRNRPSRSAAVLLEVEKGDSLTLVDQSPVGPWYRVREQSTGAEGWIHGNVITAVTSLVTAPESPKERTRPRTVTGTGSGRSYINVDGERVRSPVFADRAPAGASARCRDGSYSFSRNRRGTCSHHGGVAVWL